MLSLLSVCVVFVSWSLWEHPNSNGSSFQVPFAGLQLILSLLRKHNLFLFIFIFFYKMLFPVSLLTKSIWDCQPQKFWFEGLFWWLTIIATRCTTHFPIQSAWPTLQTHMYFFFQSTFHTKPSFFRSDPFSHSSRTSMYLGVHRGAFECQTPKYRLIKKMLNILIHEIWTFLEMVSGFN